MGALKSTIPSVAVDLSKVEVLDSSWLSPGNALVQIFTDCIRDGCLCDAFIGVRNGDRRISGQRACDGGVAPSCQHYCGRKQLEASDTIAN